MTERVLFVDDDENILNSFRRQFRKQYTIFTADGGASALEHLNNGSNFAVIVADMQMPEMNGIELLEKISEIAPDTVRIMLTGNADQQTAIDAVNRGAVFRFLNKPCPIELLSDTIDAAIRQNHLINAERDILENTVNGAIHLLTDMLSIVSPGVFNKSSSLVQIASEVARALTLTNTWNVEMATTLSQIGYVTLPPETLAKILSETKLDPVEEQIIANLPETSSKLLRNIDRLENIAQIILYQNKHYDGTGFPQDNIDGEQIPIESRILKVLLDFKDLEDNGLSAKAALDEMELRIGYYDPTVLKTVAWFYSDGNVEVEISHIAEVSVHELRPGLVLVSHIESEGRILITAGNKLNAAVVERLLNYHKIHRIKEPIQVSIKQEEPVSNPV